MKDYLKCVFETTDEELIDFLLNLYPNFNTIKWLDFHFHNFYGLNYKTLGELGLFIYNTHKDANTFTYNDLSKKSQKILTDVINIFVKEKIILIYTLPISKQLLFIDNVSKVTTRAIFVNEIDDKLIYHWRNTIPDNIRDRYDK